MAAPYYQSDACTLYLGDCLEVLPQLAAGSVAAVVTDPQYCSGAVSEASRTRAKGQGLRSENIRRFGWFTGDNMGTAGLTWLLRSVAVEAKRLCTEAGSLLMFCDWRMLPSLSPAIESTNWRYQSLVVWDKESMGLGTGFRAQHELVMHFTAGAPAYHDRGTGNVIRSKRVHASKRQHQTQKPVDLMASLVVVICQPGGTVLDPFAGSGTTGVACVQTGRKFVGVELSERYCEIAARRLENARKTDPLYDLIPDEV
jgi:DNA modification methylase